MAKKQKIEKELDEEILESDLLSLKSEDEQSEDEEAQGLDLEEKDCPACGESPCECDDDEEIVSEDDEEEDESEEDESEEDEEDVVCPPCDSDEESEEGDEEFDLDGEEEEEDEDEESELSKARAEEVEEGTDADIQVDVQVIDAAEVIKAAKKAGIDAEATDSGGPDDEVILTGARSKIHAFMNQIGFDDDDMKGVYDEVLGEGSCGSSKKKKYEENIDYSNVKQLVEKEEGLTESFKAKAALIFETEVRSQVSQIEKQIKEEYELELISETEKVIDTLTEQVDSYLTYAVEEWMNENEVAIESSLRTDITESFISSLKSVFAENYIEVPESKVDLYSELEQKANKLEEQLAVAKDAASDLTSRVDTLTREKIIKEATEDLAKTQASKLVSLSESIEYTDEDSFKSQIETLKGFYCKGKSGDQTLTEEVLTENKKEKDDSAYYVSKETIMESIESEEDKLPKSMQSYLKAISAVNRANATNK